jgi:uncharacterized protein (DUF58 family)
LKTTLKPSRRLLGLTALLVGLAIVLGSLPLLDIALPRLLTPISWGLLFCLLLAALLDALLLRRLPTPQVSRQLHGNLPLSRWSEVRLSLQHGGDNTLQIDVFDHVPAGMECDSFPQKVTLQPEHTSTFSYRLRPLQRGHFHFSHCELYLPSPLGLWQHRRLLPLPGQTRVYPDFARLQGAGLMGVDDWLNRLGVRQQQRRGLGMEFHQLREYRDGDILRQIDWKATARKRTPIVREYQDERDQQIIFLLDCGRRMRSQDGELSHFDHALNASLLLAYVALRQGDAVGLSTFAAERPRFLPPGKGTAQLNTLLNAVYDLHSTQQPADYAAAVSQLLARQKRRALVVLVSNLRDDEDEELLAALKRLGRQHLVLLASLREEVLDQLREQPVTGYDQALAYCGTVGYLNARASLHERLLAHGVPLLDVRPSELGPELVSRYLAWKKAGVL